MPGGGGGGPNSNNPVERRPVSANRSSSWFIKKRCSANSVPTPIAAQTSASRTIWEASSRARRDQALGDRKRPPPTSAWGLEDIACAAQGVDHRLAPDVDLLSQIRHVQLDNVRSPAEVIAPHPVEDLRLAQYAFGVAHHEPPQLTLRRGQGDDIAAPSDFVAVLVEH